MAERVDQQMAAQAEKVIGPLVTDPQLAQRIRTRMRQFPMRLRSSGLVAAFAFAESKSGSADPLEQAYSRLCKAIIEHAAKRKLLPGLTPSPPPRIPGRAHQSGPSHPQSTQRRNRPARRMAQPNRRSPLRQTGGRCYGARQPGKPRRVR